ncbi:MAG: hypothetical protein GEU79_08725 [Acidimicrobiia bacterium]|nr:hypothetical protein [Acidimicrobiia bacterium]
MPRINAATIEEHKALTRQRILDALQTLLVETESLEGLSLGDVSSVAGIGRTTVYEYFTDLGDVVATLVEGTLPGVVDDIISESEDIPDPAERFLTIATGMISFVVEDPVLGLILHRAESSLSPDAQSRIAAAHGSLTTAMGDAYRDGVERKVFSAMPPDVLGALVHDTTMSAAKLVFQSSDARAELDRVLPIVRSFLLNGLAGKAHQH